MIPNNRRGMIFTLIAGLESDLASLSDPTDINKTIEMINQLLEMAEEMEDEDA